MFCPGSRHAARNAFLAATSFVLLQAMLGWASGPTRAARAAPDAPDGCVLVSALRTDSSTILLGETLEVQLSAMDLCHLELAPVHIVLVLDASDAAAGAAGEHQIAAARRALKTLDLRNAIGLRVGVVYGPTPDARCGLTDNAARASGCIGKVAPVFGSSWAGGLDGARELLQQAQRDVPVGDPLPREIVVLFAAGGIDDCEPAATAARALRARTATVVTACFGPDCARACLRRLVIDVSDHLHIVDDDRSLATRLQRFVLPTDGPPFIPRLHVTHALPPGVAFIDEGALPPPNTIEDGRLVWRYAFLPFDGVTVTYRVKPLSPGLIEIGRITIDYFDNDGRQEVRQLDPFVQVLDPAPLDEASEGRAAGLRLYLPSLLRAPLSTIPPASGD